jgi:hypothetical protein
MNYSAFTIKSPIGLLSVIKTEITAHHRGKQIRASAIWDTGATRSCISPRVITAIGLTAFGFKNVQTANGIVRCGKYRLSLGLPNSVLVRDITVSSFSGGKDIDILIGMDVINLGDFSITNYGGITVVSFRMPPDTCHIDYLKGQ